MFRRLINNSGTPTVSLDKDELQMDGILDKDGEIPREQEMHVQRLGPRAYLVRAVDETGIPELDEVFE
ncbi:hypothetical protein [Halalkalirubrum salinum]|uniref:hypothetical protein n=1 Tax=Halalkalirubrum salinum TaxID=2563889 RepID=UPI0010FB1C17|nr:hypothetical protein [Halalkalirubrum salinum]